LSHDDSAAGLAKEILIDIVERVDPIFSSDRLAGILSVL
jgi:hypothetical protein